MTTLIRIGATEECQGGTAKAEMYPGQQAAATAAASCDAPRSRPRLPPAPPFRRPLGSSPAEHSQASPDPLTILELFGPDRARDEIATVDETTLANGAGYAPLRLGLGGGGVACTVV